MILITGGAWQGKRAFAMKLAERRFGAVPADKVIEGAQAAKRLPRGAYVITDLHLMTRALMEQNIDPSAHLKRLMRENPNAVLTVTELGCGIVPMEKFDRSWRESTGRNLCELARECEAVYRMTCGIATRIR